MYWIQYFCPREAPYWQDLVEGLIFKTPVVFPTLQAAISRCDVLMWQYHSVRVIDARGQITYQI